MSIAIGSDSLNAATANMVGSKVKTEELQDKLKNKSATDDELMEACKSFETYLLEQVMKSMEKTVIKAEEEESPYMEQFGDMLYEEYANNATETQGLGIAKMLYESMKRDA